MRTNHRFLKPEFLIPVLLVFIFGIVAIRNRIANEDLMKNGIVIKVRVDEFLGSMKGGTGANPNYRCSFSYKGKTYSLISSSSVKDHALSYVGTVSPALYSERMNKLRLLLTPEDYSKFGVEYSDTVPSK